MKSPNRKLLLLALLALAAPIVSPAEDYEVQGDAIVPEGAPAAASDEETSALEEEVVIVKKPKTAPKRKRVIIQEVEPAAASTELEVQEAATSGQRVGSTLDKTIDSKMNNVRSEIENQLVKAIEGIQISVGNANAPVQQVSDQVINASAAPAVNSAADNKAYLTVEQAPGADGNASVAEMKNDDQPLQGSVGIFPLGGLTTLSQGGNGYDRESNFTVGAGLEVDASENLSFVTTYRYSKYNIRITSQNTFWGYYPTVYPTYGYGGGYNNELNRLEYNQNVIDAGMRLYLLPKSQRFRFFVGGGGGYQKGYLNYTGRAIDQLKLNPGMAQSGQLDDVEITQFLFNVETGAEFQLSKALAIGGDFKYSSVLSSSVNDPTNQGWFNGSGFTSYVQQTDKALVGNSLKDASFYSILGTVKYRF
ncbi:MAG: hypothetical protein HUU37_03955 [Bdellovibrionales bacterium]|nr:hypothetical protein [Bdellovibrionales bacterium]